MRRAVLLLSLLAAARPVAADVVDAAPPPLGSAVDLLIVVDTSATAAPLRASLPASVGTFVDNLAANTGGTPGRPLLDLHVGVISTDPADGGALRPAPADCAAAPGATYLAWGAPPSFPGTLAGAITCLLPPASATGADIAQPFATIMTALGGGVAANAGFRRPDAALAVLVITAQDDCSATGAPLDRFACAQAGWSCTPPLDEQEVARSCSAIEAPAGLISRDQLATVLTAVAPAGRLVLGALRGDGIVQVTHGGAIDLAPACTNGAIAAWPALRIDDALLSVPATTWTGTACGDRGFADFADAIVQPGPELHDDGGLYSCDGGDAFGDDAGHFGDHGTDGGCGCRGGRPTSGSLLLVGLALLGVTRRSSPWRRCRARRARAAG